MKETAIEWLYGKSKLRELDKFDLEQAKEMEKQMVIEAYDKGEFNDGMNETAEEYYNHTYKK